MIDFHCHLDLYNNPISVFEKVKKQKIQVLCVTTSPRAYISTSRIFSSAQTVHVALGFHPELVAARYKERELFEQNVPSCRFIGEVGIDGTGRNKESISLQKEFFRDALKLAENNFGRIVSIHSRAAVKDVLDILENTICNNKPIMHWFTGTLNELEWAISLGCWFSINPNMCFTKKGVEIISKIPITRILPETDGPFTQKNNISYMPWDNTVIECLARYRGLSIDSLNSIMHENLTQLMS